MPWSPQASLTAQALCAPPLHPAAPTHELRTSQNGLSSLGCCCPRGGLCRSTVASVPSTGYSLLTATGLHWAHLCPLRTGELLCIFGAASSVSRTRLAPKQDQSKFGCSGQQLCPSKACCATTPCSCPALYLPGPRRSIQESTLPNLSTLPICGQNQFRLTSTVISQARQRVPAVWKLLRSPVLPVTKVVCPQKRAKLLKDRAGGLRSRHHR